MCVQTSVKTIILGLGKTNSKDKKFTFRFTVWQHTVLENPYDFRSVLKP